MRRRWLRTRVILPILGVIELLAPIVAWSFLGSNNFGAVEPGRLYRSAQMEASSLSRQVRDHQIRTVLNLRGSHPESAWYRDERAATLAEGATQVDMPFSSCEWMSRAQARALVEVLDTADRPLLIHCFHGSERTGMVAAFDILLQPGSTLAQAESQFSFLYMYFGLGDGVVTHHHLLAYRDWLRTQSLDHAPAHFRRWITAEYRPGTPCREQWNFDPYPLVVVTRRAGRPETKTWEDRNKDSGSETSVNQITKRSQFDGIR